MSLEQINTLSNHKRIGNSSQVKKLTSFSVNSIKIFDKPSNYDVLNWEIIETSLLIFRKPHEFKTIRQSKESNYRIPNHGKM